MGQAKREMERGEDMLRQAEDIAVQAGVLKRCDRHEEILLTNDVGNMSLAYALGTNYFKRGEVDGDRSEFMEAIKEASESGSGICPYCQKMMMRGD